MDAVINSSPLILLSKIERLYLLNKVFDKIYIPSAVMKEIQAVDKEQVKLSDIDSEITKPFGNANMFVFGINRRAIRKKY